MAKKLTRNQEAYQALLQKFSKTLIAQFAGVTKQALTGWDAIPAIRAHEISKNTGIPVAELLPDPCEDCQNPFCPKNQT